MDFHSSFSNYKVKIITMRYLYSILIILQSFLLGRGYLRLALQMYELENSFCFQVVDPEASNSIPADSQVAIILQVRYPKSLSEAGHIIFKDLSLGRYNVTYKYIVTHMTHDLRVTLNGELQRFEKSDVPRWYSVSTFRDVTVVIQGNVQIPCSRDIEEESEENAIDSTNNNEKPPDFSQSRPTTNESKIHDHQILDVLGNRKPEVPINTVISNTIPKSYDNSSIIDPKVIKNNVDRLQNITNAVLNKSLESSDIIVNSDVKSTDDDEPAFLNIDNNQTTQTQAHKTGNPKSVIADNAVSEYNNRNSSLKINQNHEEVNPKSSSDDDISAHFNRNGKKVRDANQFQVANNSNSISNIDDKSTYLNKEGNSKSIDDYDNVLTYLNRTSNKIISESQPKDVEGGYVTLLPPTYYHEIVYEGRTEGSISGSSSSDYTILYVLISALAGLVFCAVIVSLVFHKKKKKYLPAPPVNRMHQLYASSNLMGDTEMVLERLTNDIQIHQTDS